MPSSNGRFVWYELMTTDLAGARAFYSEVVGWTTVDAQMPGMDYWMFAAGEKPLAGLMTLPDEAKQMGAPPSWVGYVSVESVDASAARVPALGGAVHVPPTDIPNVGRFAVVSDPQGGTISLFTSANPAQDQPGDPMATGQVGWHELLATDGATIFPFYEALFGWQKREAMDMGPMGVYQIYGVGEVALGGMMTRPPHVPASHWLYYFNVGNIDDAAARVKSNGGQVLVEPHEVPGGGFILAGLDPQGAAFALFGSR